MIFRFAELGFSKYFICSSMCAKLWADGVCFGTNEHRLHWWLIPGIASEESECECRSQFLLSCAPFSCWRGYSLIPCLASCFNGTSIVKIIRVQKGRNKMLPLQSCLVIQRWRINNLSSRFIPLNICLYSNQAYQTLGTPFLSVSQNHSFLSSYVVHCHIKCFFCSRTFPIRLARFHSSL